MMYTLIVSFVFSRVVDSVLDGAYAAKGILIVSNHSEEIGQSLMASLERGVTYLNGEGAYSQVEKRVLYTVVSPREIMEVKRIANEIDEKPLCPSLTYMKQLAKALLMQNPANNGALN